MNGAVATVPLPKTLAEGNYMVRHEIMALHLAVTKRKAKFYPSCSQIKVGGNQRGASNANELVTFPGATAIVTWVSMILTYITHWNLLLMFSPDLRLLALWEALVVSFLVAVRLSGRNNQNVIL